MAVVSVDDRLKDDHDSGFVLMMCFTYLMFGENTKRRSLSLALTSDVTVSVIFQLCR